MDALALLSGEDESEDDDDPEDAEEGADAEPEAAAAQIDIGSLERAGYKSGSLRESELYHREWAKAKASSAPPPETADPAAAEAGGRAEDAPGSSQLSRAAAIAAEAEELKQAALRAAERDRKRAGVNAGESNRQKNARKMKMGQASFSLKDDRDCTNPFVDSSHAPHVQGFSGKRVDKRASVKQISNLDFTS
ncbi:unnamed protein product [Prorocentrum cordatum]|uniref:Uncharacterized protein n=1 Tax=Prorocentrum cordatum TaxID=2364126 RepID=A0ABN9X7R0_9DINO|nr:unnamed protein product [Polarella glacialis]